MSPASHVQLRELSRSLFGGAQYRVEIGAAIADADGPICAKDLIAGMEEPLDKATVSNELRTLTRAGLLRPTSLDANDRRKFLSPRTDSSYWRLCQELRDAAAG